MVTNGGNVKRVSAADSLRERIKELTCLYSLAQLAAQPDVSLDEILQGTTELLPPAWQYPEITEARIVFDDRTYQTAAFQEVAHRQSLELVVSGQRRGMIEVVYLREMPKYDEGPFLEEERSLLDAVGRQLAVVIERRQVAEEKTSLQNQLQHADRLATIGQLSAGVAHELNEPLGNILAFGQLALKQPNIPAQVAQDLEKIVDASLHAREIVRKLMLFARQMPPRKTPADLNGVVQESLSFLRSRCWPNVGFETRLSPQLPLITADSAQLNQVLVNLVVNAMHAMPDGGTLTILTGASQTHVWLVVEDTGVGMTEEVVGQIFVPFFTTKDVHEGTGLGLPVVHGIVSSHGGTIAVRSTPGVGTRFEIRLPLSPDEADESETDGVGQ